MNLFLNPPTMTQIEIARMGLLAGGSRDVSIPLAAHTSRMVHWTDEPIDSSEKPALLKPWQHKLLLEHIEETNQPVQDFSNLQATLSLRSQTTRARSTAQERTKKQQPTAKKHPKKAPFTPTSCLRQLGIPSSALQ
jgi:hypothetical protein